MLKLLDMPVSQEEHLRNVQGEPDWTHHFQHWDQDRSRRSLEYHADSSPCEQECHAVFPRKINFLRKFMFDYGKIVKPIQEMIKKYVVCSWEKKEKELFTYIKQAIAEAFALYNLIFNKYLLLYSFTSNTSLVVVLTQKDELNNEQPISFMSASLQGPELKYLTMKKQAYEVYKEMKHFKLYLL